MKLTKANKGWLAFGLVAVVLSVGVFGAAGTFKGAFRNVSHEDQAPLSEELCRDVRLYVDAGIVSAKIAAGTITRAQYSACLNEYPDLFYVAPAPVEVSEALCRDIRRYVTAGTLSAKIRYGTITQVQYATCMNEYPAASNSPNSSSDGARIKAYFSK